MKSESSTTSVLLVDTPELPTPTSNGCPLGYKSPPSYTGMNDLWWLNCWGNASKSRCGRSHQRDENDPEDSAEVSKSLKSRGFRASGRPSRKKLYQ
ncbi:hypothetical protein LDENG_00252770 [Lucifuga dentata]|nr:hypothetical protein LDENG_00252770 [Lucifuga dentata]